MGNNITDRLKYKETVVKFSKKYCRFVKHMSHFIDKYIV